MIYYTMFTQQQNKNLELHVDRAHPARTTNTSGHTKDNLLAVLPKSDSTGSEGHSHTHLKDVVFQTISQADSGRLSKNICTWSKTQQHGE